MQRWSFALLVVASCVGNPVDTSPHLDEPGSGGGKGDDLTELPAELAVTCDVVVAGGSTAALAAALTAAREGADTCLLEPTDWIGGQITAGGVPAIDFAWHRVGGLDVGAIAKARANLPREFDDWMRAVGNPGACWVSKNCFRPDAFHDDVLAPAAAAEPRLHVYLNTVVADARRTGRRIDSLTAVRRALRPGQSVGFLSDELADWYDPADSAQYAKDTIRFYGDVFIDATELGDVLVLADAPYMQGVETVDGSPEAFDDTCGQATVFPLVVRYETGPRSEPPNPFPVDHPSFYDLGSFTWDRVWTYRRILDGPHTSGNYNDFSLQNWNPGNDYAFGYLLASKAEAAAQRGHWRGGVDLASLAGAERHAYGYYYWYKAREPNGRSSYLTLDREMLGSATGLSKFPYVRDTRRSVGLEGFVLSSGHLRGEASDLTGTRFADRIAIGAYAMDVHPLRTCSLPGYALGGGSEPLPFYLPLRAHTNRDVDNLLVAGKTMAQSFIANAATRLQPIEWSSGIGAGASAAHMVARGYSATAELLGDLPALQARIRDHAPLEWTIGGLTYPRSGEVLPPIAERIYCPEPAEFDEGYGFCVSGEHAFGPFTHAMTLRCEEFGGGPACTALREVTVAGRTLYLPRWSKTFAHAIRGDGDCPRGASRDPEYLGHCTERYWSGSEWVHDVYGPFGQRLVEECVAFGGGDACYTHRWSAPFFRALAGRL